MSPAEIMSRFNSLYLGDSLLEQCIVETGAARVFLRLNAGKLLSGKESSIFEAETSFEPAVICLEGVKSIEFEGGQYQLNSTVVDFGATVKSQDGLVEFYWDLTGGADPASFLVRIKILARGFKFGGG